MGSKWARRAVGLVISAAVFAFVGTASGQVTLNDALLVITLQSSDSTAVGIVSRDNGPIAAIELDVPAAYTVDVGQPVGTHIADFLAQNAVGQVAQGAVTAADPASFTDPVSQACDPQPHVAVWSMPLSGLAPTAAAVPWFVDAAPDGGHVVHACFPAAQFGGAAGASPIQAIVLSFAGGSLHAPAAPGTYDWDALVTPFASDGQTPDPTRVIDFQAIVPLPSVLTMKSTYNAHTKTATMKGRLTLGGAPASGYTIDFTASKTRDGLGSYLGTATTSANGSFSYPVLMPKSEYVSAVPEVSQGTCTSTRAAGCFSTEYPIAAAEVHLVVPKKKAKPKRK